METVHSTIKIREIHAKQDVEKFLRFGFRVYADNSAWVPPLLEDTRRFLLGEGLFYDHCRHRLWVAEEEGQIVATLAAFCDENFQKHWNQRAGFLGFFEALPEKPEAVRELFEAGEEYLRQEGADFVYAPFNGYMANPLGLLVSAVNSYEATPIFLMPYNPSYYQDYLARLGYQQEKELIAYRMNLTDHTVAAQVDHFVQAAKNSPVRIEKFSKKAFARETERLSNIYSKTFQTHWGYAPQSAAEFAEIISPFRSILDPDLILFAVHEGQTIGFTICVPDYNPIVRKLQGNVNWLGGLPFLLQMRGLREARLIAIGVLNEWRGKDIAPNLAAHAFHHMRQKGYRQCEYSWVLKENHASRRVAEKFGGVDYRDYAVYSKKLV